MGIRRHGPFILRQNILVEAPMERCFLLSTSIELVRKELGMKPVEGRTSGLVTAGDTIRWQGWQLGFWNYHVSLISAFEPPYFFQDRMIDGRFRTFQHDHRFEQMPQGVVLRDEVRFTLPFGALGRLVASLIVVPHIRRLMLRRFQMLKRIAESEEWRKYLGAQPGPVKPAKPSHTPVRILA
jgi:ligand-binding SRPBCC domain-containing protein